jgi:hypothetical protein
MRLVKFASVPRSSLRLCGFASNETPATHHCCDMKKPVTSAAIVPNSTAKAIFQAL